MARLRANRDANRRESDRSRKERESDRLSSTEVLHVKTQELINANSVDSDHPPSGDSPDACLTAITDPDALLTFLEEQLYALRFDAALRQIELQEREGWTTAARANALTSQKIRCICAETYDYFGRYPDALRVIEADGQLAEITLANLPSGVSTLSNDALKQTIWVAIHWSYTFYRRHQYDRAMTVIQYCYSALDHLPRAQLTRARIHYTIGLIHRQQHEYREAKRFFTEAMIDASKALEDYADANKHLITAFTIAKCVGLGLAWVFYTEAALHIAEPFLITARTLLRSTPETIIRSYVDVVHGCVQRAAHGNNPILLQRAVDLLTEAYTLFKDRGHSEYQAKAANELALAHLQQAMNSAVNSDTFHKALAEAGNKADEVTRLSLDRDPRATCNALILSSRINRLDKNWPRAKQLADQALKQSQDKDARFNRIDALIAVGEAALELREYAAATKSFIQALDEGSSNPKIRAICHLHLSDAYIRQGAVKEAKAQFQQWRLVADIIENAFIHSFGRQIEATLTEVRRDFFISFSEMQLNPSELEDRLHGFIARWAKDKEEDDAEAAKRIKRSRATLYNWLNAERQWTDRGPAKESADAE